MNGEKTLDVPFLCDFVVETTLLVGLVTVFFVVASTALIRVTVVLLLVSLVFLVGVDCFFVAKIISPKIKSLLLQTVKYYTSVLDWFRQACYHGNNVIILTVILACIGVTALSWAVRLRRTARRYQLNYQLKKNDTVPSVTVCIPARNEIHALAECLERVLASDYPKLEVIVLDDSSSDDTPLIIRSFAHAGVRFIEGTDPPEGWVGKNFAMQTLLDEASGTYVLNIDADTKLAPTSISRMVATMQEKHASMVSVIPKRYDMDRFGTYVGSLRYFWELLFATRLAPPASSSAWMIDRKLFIDTVHGLSDNKQTMRSEVAIAAIVANISRYEAIVGSEVIGVGYEKRWTSQLESSRRSMYERIGGTWFKGVSAFVWLILLNIPTFVLLSGFIVSWQLIHVIAAIVMLTLVMMYATYLRIAWTTKWWFGMLLWPYVIAQELVVFMSSFIGYTRHTVTWKGRTLQHSHRDS